ncbi:excinuclease ABC subunit C [Candidatus Kaiserbacteria bacterium CG10_big_fil_rev_8_21_14_0_10_49_17]|uniref:Excinuclease ABC subunit C n=1 Tax=Candidatus Kaiserbacteria bacterium CG10_big_fil_rev_8_21_14_0_10_49_17 TaxID=1974609 RepID=A0A2M6WDS8_9BACT|nr:MAG: excinuclease ABC subunit C [Candidatus Kaiserbacteria bacterium CG10_big_fil_rev_8_21_14_0_10_49_17]
MYWVYVLRQSKTRELYIGKTNDLKRRLRDHQKGRQSATRRKDGEWRIVYAEMYISKRDADERERKLKQHGSNKRWLLERIKHSVFED